MHEGALMSDTTPADGAEFDADADAMAEEPESELIPAGPFETVRSADGTLIAFERAGSGPALILIGGAFSVRQGGYGLRDILSDRFTVYSVDRRGRGDSTDTQPYSVEREIEDLAALVGVAGADGEPVYVYGHSSGGILSLEAAARGLPIERLAVYEPPFTYDPADPTQSEPEGRAVLAALDAGDHDAAVEAFMRLTGADDTVIAWTRQAPYWPGMVAIAPTTAYDLAVTGDRRASAERLGQISIPVLVLDGGASAVWAGRASDAVVAAVPDARRYTVGEEAHGAAADVLAPVLAEFFLGA